MKTFLQRLSAHWFATITPTHTPLITIKARETMRKRRLLSVILLSAFSGLSFSLVIDILTRTEPSQQIQNLVGISFVSLSFWINRRGHLKLAGLCYLLSSFVGLATQVITSSLALPILAFGLWPLLLILLVAAGLILPAWGPLLLALIEDAFWYWFVLYGCQKQIAIYLKRPGDQLLFLFFMCAITSVIAIFSAISAWATKKAVIQADRAVELEQAHQALSVLHSDLEIAHASIQMQALTDGLTNLPNHRAVMEQFAKEIERARRHHLAFSILFFDADHFKRVNDTYGHGAGDAVLRQIGERASSCLRLGDTLGRFGGEEFVILLFEADASGASTVAERIRATVAAEPMALAEVEGGIAMTVSIGQATYIEDGQNEQELLAQADQAMYVAKRMGRNQVRSATEARQLSADSALAALWDEQTRVELLQREGVNPEQVQPIAQTILATG